MNSFDVLWNSWGLHWIRFVISRNCIDKITQHTNKKLYFLKYEDGFECRHPHVLAQILNINMKFSNQLSLPKSTLSEKLYSTLVLSDFNSFFRDHFHCCRIIKCVELKVENYIFCVTIRFYRSVIQPTESKRAYMNSFLSIKCYCYQWCSWNDCIHFTYPHTSIQLSFVGAKLNT